MKEKTAGSRPKLSTVDAYLHTLPKEISSALQHLRTLILQEVPMALEEISYGMPAYKHHGPLVYFAAFKNHCSFFPGGGNIIEMFKDDLLNFITSKGTIQFTIDNPLPDELVRRILKERKAQNEAKINMKEAKKRLSRGKANSKNH